MKIRNIFVCSECGYTSPKWLGKCPECSSWNSFVEDAVDQTTYKNIEKATPATPTKIGSGKKAVRLKTNINEVDLVFGGGIISGGLVLLSGEPGIGKSTLTLQIASNIGQDVLMLSAEESYEQISDRMERLKLNSEMVSIVSENNLEIILSTITVKSPALAIVDSVQTLYSENASGIVGSPSQVRYCTERLLNLAKEKNISILLIGHVTKDGNLAGPKSLEHLVDSVFVLEGERGGDFRILRSQKNRFGTTEEVGVFEMTERGMREVKNPSEAFLAGRQADSLGSTITAVAEGNRSFLLEVQALTSGTSFGYPKRTSSGVNQNRVDILVAVLGRYCNVNLSSDDVFLNVAGGFRIDERSADLAIAMAIFSSKKSVALGDDTVFLGEIGLSGEIRPVKNLDKRLKEAEKCGFKVAYIPDQTVSSKIKIKTKKYNNLAKLLREIKK